MDLPVEIFPVVGHSLQPLEDTIRLELSQPLLGRSVGDLEQNLLSLPAPLGGIAICNPVVAAQPSFESVSAVVGPMVQHIHNPDDLSFDGAMIR